jgi:hypothetical protein
MIKNAIDDIIFDLMFIFVPNNKYIGNTFMDKHIKITKYSNCMSG